jgi:hypothetical protein
MDDLDRLLKPAGVKSYFRRESRIGESVTGPIVEIDVRQATDYITKQLLHWPDGNIKEQVVVIVQAEGITPDDADDDLKRAVYIKGWGLQRSAFIEACKDHKPEVGDRFTATFVATKPNPKGGDDAKVYEYRVTPLGDTQPAIKAEVDSARAQAQKLLSMGTFTDEQVAAATGLPAAEVQALSMQTPF